MVPLAFLEFSIKEKGSGEFPRNNSKKEKKIDGELTYTTHVEY